MELSVIDVPAYSMFYELEKIVPGGSEDVAYRALSERATSLGLQVYDKKEYLAFIADLDAHANDVLDFSNPGVCSS